MGQGPMSQCPPPATLSPSEMTVIATFWQRSVTVLMQGDMWVGDASLSHV